MDAAKEIIFGSFLLPWIQIVQASALATRGNVERIVALSLLYGPIGFVVGYFGSASVWNVEAQIIGERNDKQALEFRKSIQDECSMIAVAAALVAQIATTSLSLNDLSQTHWVARALLVFSLISSLVAVSYAVTQHIVMAPLLTAHQIRAWIRGGNLTNHMGSADFTIFGNSILAMNRVSVILRGYGVQIGSARRAYQPCDPDELDFSSLDRRSSAAFDYSLMRQCFTPDVIPVISMSAPIILLATSVMSAIIAYGIYFGFIWTRNLDANAGENDSRNVFIVYLVALVLCIWIYFVSQLVQVNAPGSEYQIVNNYARRYMEDHPDLPWQRPQSPVTASASLPRSPSIFNSSSARNPSVDGNPTDSTTNRPVGPESRTH